jgi:hypothetical protein
LGIYIDTQNDLVRSGLVELVVAIVFMRLKGIGFYEMLKVLAIMAMSRVTIAYRINLDIKM